MSTVLPLSGSGDMHGRYSWWPSERRPTMKLWKYSLHLSLKPNLIESPPKPAKGWTRSRNSWLRAISITINGSGKKWRRVWLLSIGASPSQTKKCVARWSESSARVEDPLVEAAADFAGIIEHIHKQNPSANDRVAHSVYDSVTSLQSFRNRGRTGRIDDTRELVLAPLPFVRTYRVKRRTVEIVWLLYGSQRWP